jgi:hypothetical protein
MSIKSRSLRSIVALSFALSMTLVFQSSTNVKATQFAAQQTDECGYFGGWFVCF